MNNWYKIVANFIIPGLVLTEITKNNNFERIVKYNFCNPVLLHTAPAYHLFELTTCYRAWYGIYGRCQNRMEDFKNGVEDNLSYFDCNSILDFERGIYSKIYTDSHK